MLVHTGDGEIDFEEFCDLIANCDLHPTTCTRCEQSQYILTEDFYFGEPRPEDPNEGRPDTFRQRMAVRDEKLIHFSYAVVAAGGPLQTLLVVIGTAFWYGVSDQRNGSQFAMIAGAVSVVMTAFGMTIGCAARPAQRWAFILYALWEVASIVMALLVMGDVQDATARCDLAPGGGLAPIPTADACPQLIVGQSTVEEARAMCVNSMTEGLCEWSDRCSLESEVGCTAVVPVGTCMVTAEGECAVADASAPYREEGTLDLWGTCASTTACGYQGLLQVVGWSFCCLAVVTLVFIGIILNDSRFPLGLQLNVRHKQR
jgi:hypothetical protein